MRGGLGERSLRSRVGDKDQGTEGGVMDRAVPCWGSSPCSLGVCGRDSPFTGGSQDTSPVYTDPHQVEPVASEQGIHPENPGEKNSRGIVMLISPDS